MTGLHHDADLPPLKAPITDAMAAQNLRAIEDPAARYVEEMTGSHNDGELPPLKAPVRPT
jgi:hypothetical protein